jgi:hypothetical protein
MPAEQYTRTSIRRLHPRRVFRRLLRQHPAPLHRRSAPIRYTSTRARRTSLLVSLRSCFSRSSARCFPASFFCTLRLWNPVRNSLHRGQRATRHRSQMRGGQGKERESTYCRASSSNTISLICSRRCRFFAATIWCDWVRTVRFDGIQVVRPF